mmetsp:Transcript_4830/g.12132  ORF Transcript_4830/g.12132 Transcript_4830/m.12132 type:complete len:287 (-) Transcript_4830:433-1293(-)
MIVLYFLVLVSCLVQSLSVQGLAARHPLPMKVSFSEIPIEDDAGRSSQIEGKTIGERIKFGESVIEIKNIVTQEECMRLVDACVKAAEDAATPQTRESDKAGIVRIPTIAAAKRAAVTQTPCGDPLPRDIDLAMQTILRRTTEFIDEGLPSVISTLFETKDDTSSSLTNLLTSERLKYSSREPAVNVYTKGGEFLAHKDAQALTVLIPLSCPGRDYSGGGTAFWSQDARGHRVEDPSLIRRPLGGTAMIFGGCVTHAGVSVESGSRVVFVASFSPQPHAIRTERDI